jgi:hypothetical protein
MLLKQAVLFDPGEFTPSHIAYSMIFISLQIKVLYILSIYYKRKINRNMKFSGLSGNTVHKMEYIMIVYQENKRKGISLTGRYQHIMGT